MAPPTERRSPIGFRCIVVPLKLIREIPMRAITARIFLKEEGKLRPAFFMGCVIALIGISLISFSGKTKSLLAEMPEARFL